MPGSAVDGDVIDIALHTVKVQNFDKTIVTIPTHRLISEPFRNWRGMVEAGGRRIKRSLPIDQNSVRMIEGEELERFRRFSLLRDYIARKEAELADWNAASKDRLHDAVNARRLTNIGTFRAYISAYLRSHDDISNEMFLLVRQLPPSELGLPIEIYGFTTTTEWAAYEDIQGDLFDHLLAILPEFGLRIFQRPSGVDVAQALKHATQVT